MQDYTGKKYVQDMLSNELSQQTLTYKLDGTNKLVTYVKSELIGWYFVSIKPYNVLFQNIITIWKITFIVAFIFILLGILISIQVTNNIYLPIKQLIDKVKHPLSVDGILSTNKADEFKYLTDAFYQYDELTKTMETYIDKSSQVMERNYILNIIKGNKKYFEETDKIIQKPEIFQQESNYCIVLFCIDNKHDIEHINTQENKALSCFTLTKVANKLLSKHYKNDAIITDENEVSVLIQLLDDDIGSDFYNTLEVIQSHIRENLGFTVSISVGDIVYTKNEILNSYKSAQKYIKCKLFYGHNSIINIEKVKSHITSKTVRYPYNIEKKTFDAIKLQNVELANRYIDEFIDYICMLSYCQAINYSDQFILSIYNHFIDIKCLEGKDFADCFDTINEIDMAETIDDISHELKNLCSNIISHLKDKKTHQTNKKHKKIIDEARLYINDNYTDPNLSLELLADKVALSAGYLGKLFKNTTSVTFITYLNTIRLEKAKELLTTTSYSASKIGEMVGIYNSTYFSTLFKKAYGITPSQYRGSMSKTS
jgi:YesN/AraC family two-component response regulator